MSSSVYLIPYTLYFIPDTQRVTVSCIIPAWNEEQTIGAVISIAVHHLLVSEVIVVDDGSTDHTADVARDSSATVITNEKNCGKAQSMDRGVLEAKNDIILFLDADLRGLTANHLTALVEPILTKRSDMTIALRDRGSILAYLNATLGPWIAGERCLNKSLWGSVPNSYKKGFQIELALNHIASKKHLTIQTILLKGLSVRRKEQKVGIVRGLIARVSMIGELIGVMIKLHSKGSRF